MEVYPWVYTQKHKKIIFFCFCKGHKGVVIPTGSLGSVVSTKWDKGSNVFKVRWEGLLSDAAGDTVDWAHGPWLIYLSLYNICLYVYIYIYIECVGSVLRPGTCFFVICTHQSQTTIEQSLCERRNGASQRS